MLKNRTQATVKSTLFDNKRGAMSIPDNVSIKERM